MHKIVGEIMKEKVLELKNVNKVFGHSKSKVHAVRNVSLSIDRGEVISIVGESGSGKTTLAKVILGLLKETDGQINYLGKHRHLKSSKDKRLYWKDVQAIFQDPFASFNMFYSVDQLLNNCLKLLGEPTNTEIAREKKKQACEYVNLTYDELYSKYPFELSGGQMQRLMIARIFMLHPKILIADEPTSMIDACSRSTILDMLMKLRKDKNMTIVFITHDIGLAYYVSDSIYIMEKGVIVEEGTAEEVILSPKAEYTKQLLDDVPTIQKDWIV